VELLGNALVRFRPSRDLGNAHLGNQIGLRAAAIYSLAPAWRAYLELEAQTSVRDLSFLTTPAEWRLGVRACALGRLAFDGAAGTRLSDGLGAPDLRLVLSVRYTPAACAPPRRGRPAGGRAPRRAGRRPGAARCLGPGRGGGGGRRVPRRRPGRLEGLGGPGPRRADGRCGRRRSATATTTAFPTSSTTARWRRVR